MLQLFLILLFLVFGILSQRWKFLPIWVAGYLNQFLIYFVLPALALKHLPLIELRRELILPVLTAWLSFGLSWLFFSWLGKRYQWERSLTGCLVITAGLANTSFVGIPMVQALYGQEAVQLALLIDQAGSFIIVSSLAVVVASIYGKGKKRKRDITKKILAFPPFIFFCLAMWMNVQGWRVAGTLETVLTGISMSLTPVALTAVGMQVKINLNAIRNRHLWLGLGYKLLLIPTFIFLVYRYGFGLSGLIFQISVIETAMAPMITGSIIAISHDLRPSLASLMVGLGIPVSFLTVLGWYWILG